MITLIKNREHDEIALESEHTQRSQFTVSVCRVNGIGGVRDDVHPKVCPVPPIVRWFLFDSGLFVQRYEYTGRIGRD